MVRTSSSMLSTVAESQELRSDRAALPHSIENNLP